MITQTIHYNVSENANLTVNYLFKGNLPHSYSSPDKVQGKFRNHSYRKTDKEKRKESLLHK